MIRKGIVTHLDLGIGGFDVIRLKGRSPHQASISNNPQTPNINLVGMTAIGMICIRE